LSKSVKAKLLATILLPILAPASAFGGEVDPRFDGRWSGLEVLQSTNGVTTLDGKAVQFTATLGIADSGQLFGILTGFAPGRYIISNKSHGNTILVYSWCRSTKFTLSSDGNTIKENGHVTVFAKHRGLAGGAVGCEIWATFHRVGK
jgi:hypothetical protein